MFLNCDHPYSKSGEGSLSSPGAASVTSEEMQVEAVLFIFTTGHRLLKGVYDFLSLPGVPCPTRLRLHLIRSGFFALGTDLSLHP